MLVDLAALGAAAAFFNPTGFIPMVLEAGRPAFLGATTADAEVSYALGTTTAAGAATTGTFTAGFLAFAGLPAFLGAT